MPSLRPDPTFYPSAKQAAEAPPEELAYLAMLNPRTSQPDAIGVVDVKPGSKSYGRLVGQFEMPNNGDELHHFGWNACSASLCPWAPHPHVERRYLVVPGVNSSRIHILDTKANPRKPELVKVIEAETVAKRPTTVRRTPCTAVPMASTSTPSALPTARDPAASSSSTTRASSPRAFGRRIAVPSASAYDFAWHLGHDTMITSEWGFPNMVKHGVDPEMLLGGKYGNAAARLGPAERGSTSRSSTLGDEYQMVLELRPARDPAQGLRVRGRGDLAKDLSASVWLWYRDEPDGGQRTERSASGRCKKVIEIPAEPADPADLPPLLQGFKAVPPLITDINLSLDDRLALRLLLGNR